MEAERELDSLKCELVTQNVSNSSGVKDLQRRLRKWEWKAHLFRKMKNNYEQASTSLLNLNVGAYDVIIFSAAVPGPPSNVCLHVTSNRSLSVTFGEPEEKNGAMVTRYKSKSSPHCICNTSCTRTLTRTYCTYIHSYILYVHNDLSFHVNRVL